MDWAWLAYYKELQAQLHNILVDVLCIWNDCIPRAGVSPYGPDADTAARAIICNLYFYRGIYNRKLTQAACSLPLGLQ